MASSKHSEAVSTSGACPYEGYCGDYRITLKLESSGELIIEAEHRRTHQSFSSVFENDKCSSLTQSVFLTNDELYNYLIFLMENNCDVNDERNRDKLTAAKSSENLHLKITKSWILGANNPINRSFQLDLIKIQLEDVARLENIINDLYRRVEDLESRIVPREQSIRLKGSKFQKPNNTTAFTFTNNDCTCTNSSNTQQILLVDRPFANKQDRYQKVDFVWNTATSGSSLIGVSKGLPTSETDVATDSDDRWFFSLSGGHLFSKEKNDIPYLPCSAIKQGQRVSVILDTEHMRLAFAIDDITCTWAYELPKTVKPDELYACVIVYDQNESVSIVD